MLHMVCTDEYLDRWYTVFAENPLIKALWFFTIRSPVHQRKGNDNEM